MWPWLRPYLERRLADKRTDTWPRLHTIRAIAEEFAADAGCDGKYEMYAFQLLCHAARSRRGLRELFYQCLPRTYAETSGYNYLVAAILTGRAADTANASFWTWICECGMCRIANLFKNRRCTRCQSVFGSKYEAAVVTRDEYAITRLLVEPEGPRNLLRYAIEHEYLEFVKSILDEPSPLVDVAELWHGTGKRADGWAETRLRERILMTPSVDIFELVLTELLYRGINALEPRYLGEILRIAARNGWTDMVTHLILRGAPVQSIIYDTLRSLPLEVACKHGHDDIVRLLLDRGATSSMWAGWPGHREYFRYRVRDVLWEKYTSRKRRGELIQVPVDGMEWMSMRLVGNNWYRLRVSAHLSFGSAWLYPT